VAYPQDGFLRFCPAGTCDGGQCCLALEQIDASAFDDNLTNYRVVAVERICAAHARHRDRPQQHIEAIARESLLLDAVPRQMELDAVLGETRSVPRRSERSGVDDAAGVPLSDQQVRGFALGVGWTRVGWTQARQLRVQLHGGDGGAVARLQASLDAAVGAGNVLVAR
jgi:hypothetical protein